VIPGLDAVTLRRVLTPAAARLALGQALLDGLDPTADPPRSAIETDAGQLLLMPSAAGPDLAVKLVSVAPGNPAVGRPRVQGVVVLFDAQTLAPVALIDGIALTTLRTPAVSALAAAQVSSPAAHRLVVFGSGPQAEGHVEALRVVRPIDEVVIVGRDRGRAAALAAKLSDQTVKARTTDDVAADLMDADLVVCATTARGPLFNGDLIKDGACVIAVGSHEPDACEVDAALVGRSRLIVEDVDTALAEAGDLILAGVQADQLTPLAAIVRGAAVEVRPTLIKTVGMAWEDAVIAAAAVRAWTEYPA
jgi:ornithine cyclodeaminase/alanine dehydrogenase-like protein (mu-crystallin family)